MNSVHWEIVLINLQLSSFEKEGSQQNIKSNLGDRKDVLKKMTEILPMVEFDGVLEGIVDEDDLYLEWEVDIEDPVPSISMVFYSEEEAGILKILRRIQERSQWQAFDTTTNQFIDFQNDPLAGFRKLKSELKKEILRDQAEVQRRQLINQKYQKKSYLASIPYFFIVGISTFIWFRLFRFLADLVFRDMEKEIFLIFPDEYFWVLPALFISFISAIPPFLWFYHWVYRKDDDEFREYLEISSPYGYTILKVLAIIYFVLIIGYVSLSFNWYTRFSEKEIVINKLWGLKESNYPYEKVKLIYSISEEESYNGEPYFIIVFENGEQWISYQQGVELSKKRSNQIIQLVEKKSGKKLIE